MSYDSSQWMFDVLEADVFVSDPRNGESKSIRIPTKKALVAADTGEMVGIVGKNYKIVTNKEACELCRRLCVQVLPASSPSEWTVCSAAGTRSRSRVTLDLRHKSHVMNLWGLPGGGSETYTPFLRVTNSYNGLRALRFDVGFMRKHCSNGMIFEEKVVTVKAAHTKQAIAGLDFGRIRTDFAELEARFVACLERVRTIGLAGSESLALVKLVTGWPESSERMNARQRRELAQLDEQLAKVHNQYRAELGGNAYASFNTITDLATRPPRSFLIRREPSVLQQRAGMWLRSLLESDRTAGASDTLRLTREMFS